jgi:hypothetical protein
MVGGIRFEDTQEMALQAQSHGCLRGYHHSTSLGDVDVLDGLLADSL